MRLSVTAALFAIFLLTSTAPTVAALPAVPVENGMIFGGQSTDAANATVSTSNLSDLPAVVEVYTATWCENCVYVEHALDELYVDGLITPYHIHSTLSDPFGDDVLEQRFQRPLCAPDGLLPLTAGTVFNGTMKKAGSVPILMFTTTNTTIAWRNCDLAQHDLGLGVGTTMFSWTPATDNSGTIGWALDINDAHLENMTLNVVAWVVESAADYDEVERSGHVSSHREGHGQPGQRYRRNGNAHASCAARRR